MPRIDHRVHTVHRTYLTDEGIRSSKLFRNQKKTIIEKSRAPRKRANASLRPRLLEPENKLNAHAKVEVYIVRRRLLEGTIMRKLRLSSSQPREKRREAISAGFNAVHMAAIVMAAIWTIGRLHVSDYSSTNTRRQQSSPLTNVIILVYKCNGDGVRGRCRNVDVTTPSEASYGIVIPQCQLGSPLVKVSVSGPTHVHHLHRHTSAH